MLASGAVGAAEPVAPKPAIELAQAPDYQQPAVPPRSGPEQPRLETEIGGSHETLTRGLPDWSSVYLDASYELKARHTLYGGVRHTRRFGLDDDEIYGGIYYPLADAWTGVLEGSLSPTHEVLARYSAYGQLLRSLPHGFLVGAGLRHTEYTAAAVNMLVLSVERYWGAFRGAYTLYASRLDGAGTTSSHRFQLNYYYGERSNVGISYTTGKESENVGPPRGIITTDVENWTLSGRHWLTRGWAVTYDLVMHEQGNLYRREGFRLGVRHLF